MSMEYNERYFATKIKWSGKTERILCLRNYSFATIHPKTGAVTNEWPYDAITSIDISVDDLTVSYFSM